ncbi:MAG: molybdopterin molybdotransferase MoeA [Oscillospiraceae bacterium]|nr:molybdopterin molybdotransferase MoeA [Oscillospiraceae bacterium]
MLEVKTPKEALGIIGETYKAHRTQIEKVPINNSLGRVLSSDLVAIEHVPGFDRSTVDGYAVLAKDTFGCSESMPAVLTLAGEVLMGAASNNEIKPDTCVAVSTGGDLPEGADAVVMVEHTEDYGGGLIGIMRPAAPGNNIIFKGDDVSSGDIVLKAGTMLTAHDLGILSALGSCEVGVMKKPVIGVISTGDELVELSQKPGRGQIRDVNTTLLVAAAEQFGGVAINYGIIRDEERPLTDAVKYAVSECDVVLISGGSSAGLRDLTAHVVESVGELLFHGIAVKPGKPTIFGLVEGKPVFGLPGHPVAAYMVAELFVRPLVSGLMGAAVKRRIIPAIISEAVSSNHGREEYLAVIIGDDGAAKPVRGKSGLIAGLKYTDGHICIPRDSEGIPAGALVDIVLW